VDDQEAYIRREMEHTRAAMSAKIVMLQERVRETVEETESAVVGTLNTVLKHVKQVQDTIVNVTSTVDTTMARVEDLGHKPISGGQPGVELIADMSQRPWIMLGAAVLMGYILSSDGRPSSVVCPAAARSTSDANLDRLTTDHPTDNPITPPTSSSVGCTSIPSHAPMTDPAGPQ
jgi:hypothetical protein